MSPGRVTEPASAGAEAPIEIDGTAAATQTVNFSFISTVATAKLRSFPFTLRFIVAPHY